MPHFTFPGGVMPHPTLYVAQALRGVKEIDAAGGWWEAMRPVFAVRLLPTGSGLPAGWTQFKVDAQAPDGLQPPCFQAESGAGYQDLPALLQQGGAGGWRIVVYVPPGTLALAMTLSGQPGPVRLASLRSRPVLRPEAALRWALPLLARLLRRPARLPRELRRLALIWRRGGQAALRDAACAWMRAPELRPPDETLRADRSGGPDRYVRWQAAQTAGAERPAAVPPQGCRFSVLVLAGTAPDDDLAATLASLRAQDWPNWECLLGVPADTEAAARLRQPGLPQVATITLADSERGAGLTTLAASATGEWLLVLDPGDRLAPGALAALAAFPDADIVHGDEDRITAEGRRHAPFLKPGWSPELLHAVDYLGRPVALRRALVARLGGFRPGSGAGADWDLHLRLSGLAGLQVARVADILCHRPDAVPPDAAARRALCDVLAAHWRRAGLAADVTPQPGGSLRTRLTHPPATICAILAGVRGSDELAAWLGALPGAGCGTALRIVVVPAMAGAPPPEWGRLAAAAGADLVAAPEPFTRGAACMAGAAATDAGLLLFLDPGLAPAAGDWLAELADFARRPGVGVAAALRLDGGGRIAEAGMYLGPELAAPLFCGAPGAADAADDAETPFGAALLPRDVALAAGCLMIRRGVLEQAGGFDPRYLGRHADAALCLAVRDAGWRIAVSPFAAVTGAPAAAPPEARDMQLLAADLLRLGYQRDPYLPPGIDAEHPRPRLRIGKAASSQDSLAAALRQHGGAAPGTGALDLWHDADVAAATGMAPERLFWPPLPADAVDDLRAAAGWCMDLLRRRPDLRQRFPHALSSGPDGAFAHWLAGPGAAAMALPPALAAHVRAALGARLGEAACDAVLTETRLAGDMRGALLPGGRGRLLAFLLQRDSEKLRLEEIWWLALSCAEDPARALMLTHRFQPDWQEMFPDAPTVFGQHGFAAWFAAVARQDGAAIDPSALAAGTPAAEQLRLAYLARPDWQRRHPAALHNRAAAASLLAWLASAEAGQPVAARDWTAAAPAALADALAAPGVNLIGHFGYPSGLRTSALSVLDGLQAAGLEVVTRNVPVDAGNDLPVQGAHDGFELHDTTLLHIQPEPFFRDAYRRAGLAPRRPRTHRIGYWYWELETAPASWRPAVEAVDEVWVATRFVADALRARFDVPVFELMPGVALPPFVPRPASAFGLPPGRYAFLFTFNMMSGMERKNPRGLIRAFRLAFPSGEAVVLVLKTSFGDRHPELLRQLREAADGPGAPVLIIDSVFTGDETISLMAACDAYVSLHRSEGLGLTMAEAMLLAKPVIATGYSGNIDFMNDGNSLLVEHRLVGIEQAVPPYSLGERWAEPSELHAASLMRRVWQDPAAAAELGLRAKADIAANLSVRAAGARMAGRLAAIRAMRRQDAPGAPHS